MRNKIAAVVISVLIASGLSAAPAHAEDPFGASNRFSPGSVCSTMFWRFNLYKMQPNHSWKYIGKDVMGGRAKCPRAPGVKF